MKNGLSSKEKRVLLELSRNARLSDRELASRLKTSQPTITRIRTRLWEEKFVDRFLILPNLERFGLDFHAFTFVKAAHPAILKKIIQWGNEQGNVVFAAEGEGLNNHHFLLESLHPDYGEYQVFIKLFREKFPGQAMETSSFFVDVSNITKFYHWHTLLEHRLAHIGDIPRWKGEVPSRVSNRERLRQALGKIPNPLRSRDVRVEEEVESKEKIEE
ncbi:MAG: Lrp/AsnC family transcriptional regulator [Candidatus Diapherotrites archaeon]|nr:Lrp/AsnC family transcriptional regulator [Candidatus Diapherotrites archaeon]